MGRSIRERIVREITTRCGQAIAPVPVLRVPTVPIPREASPALLLFVEGETVTAQANVLVDRQLTVRLVALARGADAFEAIDRLMVAAHGALRTGVQIMPGRHREDLALDAGEVIEAAEGVVAPIDPMW